MIAPKRQQLILCAIVFCAMLVIVGVLTTLPSNGSIVSARGGTTYSSRTTQAVFLPAILSSKGGLTTYASFLLGSPSVLQIMGTGGLLGFGIMLGLLLLYERPR